LPGPHLPVIKENSYSKGENTATVKMEKRIQFMAVTFLKAVMLASLVLGLRAMVRVG
jgi:hypothetical protein